MGFYIQEQLFYIATVVFLIQQTVAFYSHHSLPEELKRHARSSGLLEDKFTEFDVTSLKDTLNSHGSQRTKRSTRFIDGGYVHLDAFGQLFVLRLRKSNSLLGPGAFVQLISDDEVTSLPLAHASECYFTGEVSSHGGTAVFSACSEDNFVHGNIVADGYHYHIQSLPPDQIGRQRRSTSVFDQSYIVARKRTRRQETTKEDKFISRAVRRRLEREVGEKPREITVEIAVFIDAAFYDKLNARGRITLQQKIDYVLLKWNGVQYDYNRPEFGYIVHLHIKLVHFYETNPDWYTVSNKLGKILKSVVKHEVDGPPYDVIFIHTGIDDNDVGGRAGRGGICDAKKRVGITGDASWGAWFLISHELGHLFNMSHTNNTACGGLEGGIMGGGNPGWTSCSVASAHEFIQSPIASCLYEQNITTPIVGELDGLLPGMRETPDESCEGQYGLGYRYWVFPHLSDITSCSYHVCLNTNFGNDYGKMITRPKNIAGMYCGPGKACLNSAGGCMTYAELLITSPVTVRVGGWSDFGAVAPDSRKCGTGARVARRICNNPTPLNGPTCDGEEYSAELTSTQPCPGDSGDYATLRNQRASEVCRKLLRNGIVDSAAFGQEGISYRGKGIGSCEVKCKRIDGGSNGLYKKWGLFDDGVPCDLQLERGDWPRASGVKGHCLQGKCKPFGCDGKLPGKSFDGCEVCGGDDTSCDIVSDVNKHDDPGQRKVVITIPAGAYGIEISMERQSKRTPRMYLELWTKDGEAVLAKKISSSGIADTTDNPITFADTKWDYDSREFLLAKGPVDQPVVVKLLQSKTYHMAASGVKFEYSAPLGNRICAGTCQNGGTWANCGCICPSGFGGKDCTSTEKVCFNGATVDPETGSCTCNIRTYGDRCLCRLPFTGENCLTCKQTTCENCGQFDEPTCRCNCPIGYGGLRCEKTCQDSISDCDQRKTNGDCDGDAVYMEENCPLTCGHCQATDASGNVPALSCADPVPILLSECTPSEFKCSSGQCIDLRLAGNGVSDCDDGTDEPATSSTSTGSNIVTLDSLPVIYASLTGFFFIHWFLALGTENDDTYSIGNSQLSV